ncbi:MAG: galactokinase, partial [Clostridiales bacterium]|nr:galactokinase [Clostridiales bacterium]
MKTFDEMYASVSGGGLEESFKKLYMTADEVKKQRARYLKIMDDFAELYGKDGCIDLFSAPGRTEIGGNHTDHNHGKVLAGGINLDAAAVVAKRDGNMIRVKSAGHDMNVVDISVTDPVDEEKGHSSALVRGVCAGFLKNGYKIGGFDAATHSNVLAGSGLSSSAAFEVLIGTILSYLYNDGKVSAVEIAKIAQYAENKFFGKPCGLMDQTACSVGGFVAIDFKDPENPKIEKPDFDFGSCGHALCIVDTGGSHAELTGEYAAVREEMENTAKALGKSVLREVDKELLISKIPEIREKVGDRAVIRALHFYGENERVDAEVAALKRGDFEGFKALVSESGRSSFMYNQNVFTCKAPASQPVSLALALSDEILSGRGAFRVHGGGFAGTIQAFVPDELLSEY